MPFHKIADVGKDFGPVRLHQKLVPGTGVELDLHVPHPGILHALHGSPDARAVLAHRVGITGQEEHRQVFRHPGQKGRVVQPQDAREHAVIGIQRKREGAPLIGEVLVHLGRVAVEPVVGGAALQSLVVAQERKLRHQPAAMLPAEKDRQHPADRAGKRDQRFRLEAGPQDDGTVQLTAPLAQILPCIERAHAVTQQEIRHTGVELFRQNRHGVKVIQHCPVDVRLGKIAVVGPGPDGPAMAQMVVSGHEDAPCGEVLGQRLVAVDELHHPVRELYDGAHFALRHTAERMKHPPRCARRQRKIDHLAHSVFSFLRPVLRGRRSSSGKRSRCSSLRTARPAHRRSRRSRSFPSGGTF